MTFLADLGQAAGSRVDSSGADQGGVIFNLSNILLVAAIDIAGMLSPFRWAWDWHW